MEHRKHVAVEAARLLYHGRAKEYKDAKELAAKNLGVNNLPSNYEVAIELDRYAQEVEGPERYKILVQMRKTALRVMKTIEEFEPRLTGSVWRGTARQRSDIDIIVYHPDSVVVGEKIAQITPVKEFKQETFYQDGTPRHSTHIHLKVDEFPVEIVVRPPTEKEPERCEIYRDIKKGIRVQELEKLIKLDPLRRFIPRRKTN
jgi:predicted nucleotidyltransferase